MANKKTLLGGFGASAGGQIGAGIGASMGLGSLGAMAAGAGIGAAPALAALAALKSQAHWEANTWVKNFQNPFHKAVSEILDPIAEMKKSGTYTMDEAQKRMDDLNWAISQYEDNAKYYETQGSDEKRVIGQMRKTIDPQVTQWRSNLQADLDSFKPKEPLEEQVKPPTLESVVPGTTPKQAINQAGMQQKKHALAAPGRRGTLLGGTMSQPGLSLKRPTLLGY